MKHDKSIINIQGRTQPENNNETMLGNGNTIAESNTVDTADSNLSPAVNIPIEKGNTILNLYKIESDPLNGGMGCVFRVYHKGWNVDLAMKQPKHKLFQTQKQKKNFTDECEHWISLGLHPHIVSCYYVREINGIPSIFSEWMDGGSLKNFIENGKLYEGGDQKTLERILDISIQFVRGLHYAHKQQLIHHDVKPDNLLLTKEGMAKVADFGIANAMAGSAYSPAYCSPEQRSESISDNHTDIWSWAVSVLEMFTGKRQWQNGVVAGLACEEYFEVAQVTIPEAVKNLLRRCFRENPNDRPDNFEEIEKELISVYQETTGNRYARREPKAAADTSDSLNNRALSFIDLGRSEEAEKYWEKALKISPDDPVSSYNYIMFLWQQDRIEDLQAVEMLSALHLRKNSSSQTALLLVKAHLQRFDLKDAVYYLSSIEESQINNEDKKEIEELEKQIRHFQAKCDIIYPREGSYLRDDELAISKDERYLVLNNEREENDIRIWDLQQKTIIKTINIDGISSRGKMLFSESNNLIMFTKSPFLIVYEWQTGKEIVKLDVQHLKISDRCFVQETLRVCINNAENKCEICDFVNNEFIHVCYLNIPVPDSATFSYGGRYVAVKSDEQQLAIYDAENGECIRICKSKYFEPVRKLSISSDGRYAIVNHIFEVDPPRLFDLSNGRQIALNTYFTNSINHHCSAYFTPQGNKFFYQEKGAGFVSFPVTPLKLTPDFILQRVNPVDTLLHLEFLTEEFTEKIEGLIVNKQITEALEILETARSIDGFTKSDKYEDLCVQLSKYCRIRSIRSCRRLNFFNGYKATKPLNEGLYMLAYGGRNEMDLWETKTGKHIRSFTGHTGLVKFADITPDNNYIVSASDDDTVKVWETFTGKCIHTVPVSVKALCISPDGRYAYMIEPKDNIKGTKLNVQGFSLDKGYSFTNAKIGEDKRSLVILEIKNKSLFRMFPVFEDVNSRAIIVSPDGYECLAGGSAKNESGKHKASIITRKFTTNHDLENVTYFETTIDCIPKSNDLGQVSSLAISKDGNILAAGSECNVFIQNNSIDKFLLLPYEGKNGVEAIAMTPDGSFVFSGYVDGVIRIIDVKNASTIYTFQEHSKLTTISYDPYRHLLYSNYERGEGCIHQLDFDYEFPGWADWDEGARPYLDIFLKLHPNWDNKDVDNLIKDLQLCGYGWIRPEGVRAKLKSHPAKNQGNEKETTVLSSLKNLFKKKKD